MLLVRIKLCKTVRNCHVAIKAHEKVRDRPSNMIHFRGEYTEAQKVEVIWTELLGKLAPTLRPESRSPPSVPRHFLLTFLPWPPLSGPLQKAVIQAQNAFPIFPPLYTL